MFKYINHRVLKTALATFLAVLIAQCMGIQFAATAGTVAITTIQSTKKESIKLACERFITCAIGLVIAVILIYFVGFNPFALGVFVLIFLPICLKFDLVQGFLATVILTTHLIASKELSINVIINEFAILFLGMSIALGLNLYMPSYTNEMESCHDNINNIMKKILFSMSDALLTNAVPIDENMMFKELKQAIYRARKISLKEYDNTLFESSRFYIELFNLKRFQFKVLQRMRRHFLRLHIQTEYTSIISEFTNTVAKSIGKNEYYKQSLEELEIIKEFFKSMELPKTREEFENRAILFQFFNDIEEFLELKQEFLTRYTLDGKELE